MKDSKNPRNGQPTEQEPSKKTKRKKKKGHAMRIFIITLIITLFAVVGGGLGIVLGIIKNTPDVSELDIKPTTNFTSFVYDDKGNHIDSFSGAENRIYVTLDNIPDYLQKAFISLEDERFYSHNGIDIQGIMRAVVTNIKTGSFSEGASTITQQLIKNNILTSEKKLTRKIQEQYLAIQFEKLYDKDLILEYYLNTIALGHGVNGVQAASNRYFGKDVSKLSLAESAVIAVITQAPTKYSPILNPDNNRGKVEIALRKMVEQGYITEEERQEALKEDPYSKILKVHQEYLEKSTRNYFVDAVMESVITDLQEQKGMTDKQANNLIYGGGLQIYTTLNTNMQQTVENTINNESLYPKESYALKVSYSATIQKANGDEVNLGGEGIVHSESEIETFKQKKLKDWGITDQDKILKEVLLKMPQPQAAFVVMDYHNGHVKALSGGRGDKPNRAFNRATQAKRQPGSAFKILAAYAPALDTGKLSPSDTLIDEPLTIHLPTGDYTPKNWNGRFEGPTSVRRAIYQSMNILAIKTMQLVGIDTSYNYLLNFGFSTLTTQDKVHSLPLGGLTEGVTPLELNAAYGAIANDGVYVKPILYTKVLDKDGNILLDNTNNAQNTTSHRVIQESTAHILTQFMQDVITQGTGSKLRSTFNAMPVAGKTGTTSDDKDLVFSGYTPYYVATIWTGHDTPKPLRYRSTGSYHLDIWGKIMQEIHKPLPYKAFPNVEIKDGGGVEVKICTLSHKRATSLCEADPNHVVKTEYFAKDEVPKETCDVHGEVEICTVSNKRATQYCPQDTRIKKTYIKQNGKLPADIPTEDCDIHLPTDVPEEPDLPDEWPDELPTPVPTPNPEPTPVPTPNPPVITPDDEDNFFIPQN